MIRAAVLGAGGAVSLEGVNQLLQQPAGSLSTGLDVMNLMDDIQNLNKITLWGEEFLTPQMRPVQTGPRNIPPDDRFSARLVSFLSPRPYGYQNLRANQWHWPYQPIIELKFMRLLGSEPPEFWRLPVAVAVGMATPFIRRIATFSRFINTGFVPDQTRLLSLHWRAIPDSFASSSYPPTCSCH